MARRGDRPQGGLAGTRQRGMTLVEVAVAALVLLVGLVGVLGIKLAGLQAGGQAHARTLAAMHATDIIDRMRANPVRARAGEYNLALAADTPAVQDTIAKVDLAQWRRGISTNLPSGTGSVTVTVSGSAAMAQIVIQWSERSAQNQAASVMSYTFQGRL